MTYGDTLSSDHQNGEDDLGALMQQFVEEHQNGYILLSVFRCVDEYYYFEYTDAEGDVYGIARVHYQRLSNRRIRSGQAPSTSFQKKIMIPN